MRFTDLMNVFILIAASLVCFCSAFIRERVIHSRTIIGSSESPPEWFKKWKDDDAAWKMEDAAWKTKVDTRLDNVDTRLDNVDSRLGNVELKLEKNEPLWKKASQSFETLVRSDVRVFRGPFYASQLTIRSLSALAERCLPAYNFDKGEKFKQQNIAANVPQVGRRIDRFTSIAIQNLPNLRDWMRSKESTIADKRKVGKLQQEFEVFDSLATETEKLNSLRYSPLGFYAYSRSMLRDPDSYRYVEELELDVTGEVTMFGKSIMNAVGEIKSGPNYKDGIVQLVRRIGILYMAAKHSLSLSDYSYSAVGELYGADEWSEPDLSLIEAAKVEAGIAEYPDQLEVVCKLSR
jgi:hypothetical protein